MCLNERALNERQPFARLLRGQLGRRVRQLAAPSRLVSLALPIAYFITALACIQLTGQAGNIAALWASTSILVVALLGHRAGVWPMLILLSFGADLAANLVADGDLLPSLLIASFDALEALIVAATMRRFQDQRPWHVSPHNMVVFVFSAAAAAATASFFGSLALAYLEAAPFGQTWALWSFADGIGLITITPFLLSWADRSLWRDWSLRRLVECLALTVGTCAATLITFTSGFPFIFLILPALALLTLRTGLQGATTGVTLVALLALALTLNGVGPIAASPSLDPTEQIRAIQLFVFAATLITLPTAIMLAQRSALAAELKEQAAIGDAALENMSHGLSMFDGEQRLITCNRRYADMYGVPAHLAQRGTPYQKILEERIVKANYPGSVEQYVSDMGFDPKETSGKIDFAYAGRHIEIHRCPLPQGGWLATHEDVTERRLAEHRIEYLATRDPLTDLCNRARFGERLAELIARSRRGHGFALHMIDLDRFKEVNDTLGHWVGDGVLKEVAVRLRAAVRDGDEIARLGGDEFAVLQFDAARPDEAASLAGRIGLALAEPYTVQGLNVAIGAAIGIALAPRDASDGDDLMKKADLALYDAKSDGLTSIRFFEPGMDAVLQKRRVVENDLRSALTNEELEVYYQPILHLKTNTISGFEALVRWNHPLRGLLEPSEFIPVAEQTGQVVAIGEWVLRQACREAARWPDDVKVAVNLSPVQFRRGDLLSIVKDAVKKAGLAPQRLELELTETAILKDEEWVRAILTKLRGLGIGLAMDDFGTGYSSLSYLRNFPFSRIKIDRSFVCGLNKNNESLAIVQTTLALATKLGLSMTAEGVETREELDLLRSEGCGEVQGYYVGRPLPAHEVASTIRGFDRSRHRVAAIR